MYEHGEGVKKNLKLAVRWYTLAAEDGNKDAQDCLGDMYALGEGVEKNRARAIHWYTKAAEQDYVYAHTILSRQTDRSCDRTTTNPRMRGHLRALLGLSDKIDDGEPLETALLWWPGTAFGDSQ